MEWDRSYFARSGYELAIEEALLALRRLLENRELAPQKRSIITDALNVLTSESRAA